MRSPRLPLLAFAALAATAPAAQAAPVSGVPASTSPEALRTAVASLTLPELELLRQTNAYRASLGLRPLLVSARLQREARWYARDMAAHDGFTITHVDSLGRDLWSRLADFNYGDAAAAQNTGTGSPDGASMFLALKASPSHDRTMRGKDFRVTSVAVAENPAFPARWYWAATFGTVDDRPRFDTVIQVPGRPRLAVSRCAGDRVLLRSLAAAPVRAVELQVRGRRGWGGVRHIDAARVCVAVAPGARARARAVAYPASVAGADRGAWRTIRGPRR